MIRRSLAPVLALLLGWAAAAIGDPPEALLEALAPHAPVAAERGGYRAAEGFRFELEPRGGLVYAVRGEGPLSAANADFMADLIGAATGYGTSIAQPMRAFLGNRVGELSGSGPVVLGVEEYLLELEVEPGEPHPVRFSLTLQETPEEAFPSTTHSLGPADAPFVVREFSDFQCPYCANFAREALPPLKERLLARGDVRFEFHHFPLRSIHPNAFPAAEAAECVTAANDPDAFWTFHDALFERQRAWAGMAEPTAYFVRLAGELGLATDGVATCLEDRRFVDDVTEAYRAAAGGLRLTGTPTVFLNGYRVKAFLDPEAYLEVIEMVEAFSQEE